MGLTNKLIVGTLIATLGINAPIIPYYKINHSCKVGGGENSQTAILEGIVHYGFDVRYRDYCNFGMSLSSYRTKSQLSGVVEEEYIAFVSPLDLANNLLGERKVIKGQLKINLSD